MEKVLEKAGIKKDEIVDRGMLVEDIVSQLEIFERGVTFINLDRPCTAGDGIEVISDEETTRLIEIYTDAIQSGRGLKFVPASGAATRMFKSLLSLSSDYDQIDTDLLMGEQAASEPVLEFGNTFISSIEKYAFYNELRNIISANGLDIKTLIKNGQFRDIIDYTLFDNGLNYAALPKGLINFHQYQSGARTPIEEHIVEAINYVQDRDKKVRLHFTVSPEHLEAIKTHVESACDIYRKEGIDIKVGFSIQDKTTDTIAVDLENRVFRTENNDILFRPGGHGALIENLNNINGDIVFIKNIDNVVPDRLKGETYRYKAIIGGLLVDLQHKVFEYIRDLSTGKVDEKRVRQMAVFADKRLFIDLPKNFHKMSLKEKVNFLFVKFNRPIRVCGMVRNEGETGGGPFWVKNPGGTLSPQIVETSQINMESPDQKRCVESATHFNPVDIVCGLCDYNGEQFDLTGFVDHNTCFIAKKSQAGRDLKALELPGLWNGAMAFWNTVFVDVPLITFNPVKTVNDLLREEHQEG